MSKPNRGLLVKPRDDRAGIWEVGEYIKGKWKRRITGLVSSEAAQDARRRLENQRQRGFIFELSERKIDDMMAAYIDEREEKILAKVTFDIIIKNLTEFWGDKTLAQVTEGTCNAYYAWRNEKHKKRLKKLNREITEIANGTVGRELRQFRAMITRDFKMGRIVSKPHVWIWQEINKRPVIPTRKEVILEARKSKPGSCRRKYILIAFYTGARKGAVLSLRWHQVLPHQIDFNESGAQSNKKKAIIPLKGKLKSYMRIWKMRGTDLGPVIHENQRPIKSIKKPPNNLRHAAAVHMLINGIDPYKVAKYLGNTIDMIENHYGHLIPGHLDEAAEALG